MFICVEHKSTINARTPIFMFKPLSRTIPLVASLCLLVVVANAQAAKADQRDFTLHNETNVNIQALHISNSGDDKWSGDILGVDELLPDESTDIVFEDNSASCLYDIRAVTDDGEIDERQVNLCETIDFSVTE